MARKTRLTPYSEQIVEAFDESGSEFPSFCSTPPMATKDGFPPDEPLPLFFPHATEAAERRLPSGRAHSPLFFRSCRRPRAAGYRESLEQSSYLVAKPQGEYFGCNGGNDRFAILSVGNPIALFASAMASLAGISAPQSGNGQSTPAIQSTASAQALQPAARDAPTRDEIVDTFKL